MNSPLIQLIITRFREFYREPIAIFWVYCFPMILALGLGLAFPNKPITIINVDFVADSPGEQQKAEQLKRQWEEIDPRVKVEIHDEKAARNRLRTAKTPLLLMPDAESASHFRYVFDESNPASVLARIAVDRLLLKASHAETALPIDKPVVQESGGRYIDFLIPGLIGTNLMGGGLFGVGFLIVDMRVRKLLKRFMATPMRKSDFMLAVIVSRLVFTVAEVAVFLLFAYLFFNIKIHGSVLAFIYMVFLGRTCFSGIGLLVACRAQKIETASGLMNLVMLPSYILSGVFFSATNFPDFAQPIIQALPLTALINGLRVVMNEGSGFEALLMPTLVLGTWTVVSVFLAIRWFRWR